MTEIKSISAEWQHGGEKSDVAELLNLVHLMAGNLAQIESVWWLARTCTEENYILNEWTNGIVDIGAETWKDCGEHKSHHYYMRPCVKESE